MSNDNSDTGDMVKVYGLKSDGSMDYLGETLMSPRMKAAEMVREFFGPIEDGNEADTVLYICEEILSYADKFNNAKGQTE